MKQYVTLEDGTCFYQMMTEALPDPCIPGEGGRIFHLDYMIAPVLFSPHFVVRRDEHRVVSGMVRRFREKGFGGVVVVVVARNYTQHYIFTIRMNLRQDGHWKCDLLLMFHLL